LLPPLVGLTPRFRELSQVKFHKILNQAVHLLLVVLQALSIDDVLLLEVAEELPQILEDLLIHLIVVVG